MAFLVDEEAIAYEDDTALIEFRIDSVDLRMPLDSTLDLEWGSSFTSASSRG